MTDKYIELYAELEKSVALSKEAFLRHLFRRSRTLVVESCDRVAIEINMLIDIDQDIAREKIYNYADQNDEAVAERPQYHCNLVFLYALNLIDFLKNHSEEYFEQCWDIYSLSVEGVDGNFDTDCNEITEFFRNGLYINNTFDGFMAKILSPNI